MKLKLWMVEEGESFDEIPIEGKKSRSREDLLKNIKTNFEGLSLRNIESLQEIIIAVQEIKSEIVEGNSELRTKWRCESHQHKFDFKEKLMK